MFSPTDYLELAHTEHRVIFDNVEAVWQVLPKIAAYLQFRLKPAIHGRLIGKPFVSAAVFVGKGTVIEQGAMIKGPAWIGENCEIRSGCYIRENVILGDGVVAGNSSEFKNCLVFDEAQVPHFNYVGDSLLGFKAHLGAGVILSNVKLDRSEITVGDADGKTHGTGLRKFGAVVGDHAEVGCNSVLSPGSILGRHTIVYPGTQWRGVLPARTIAKTRQAIELVPRRGLD
jgi:UDP-N-acetylglucosamine diphosphorylase / glucose-1-phosphate thymidylyltransferase / UDP-N-acetylgalactosamine diphosphorylase / glucosamine-1-phosphate N-acetyltransferase / galactosamine-1-phosphate N-acetyltransferase